MKLGHSERERKGVYGLGSLWRIVWCMEIGAIGVVKVGQRRIRGWTDLKIDPDEKGIDYRAEFLLRANETARSYGDKVKQEMVVLTDRTRDILIINSLGEMAEDLQKRVVFFHRRGGKPSRQNAKGL